MTEPGIAGKELFDGHDATFTGNDDIMTTSKRYTKTTQKQKGINAKQNMHKNCIVNATQLKNN